MDQAVRIRENGDADRIMAAMEQQDEWNLRLHALTPQQRTVFKLVVEGHLNKQIAYELGISLSTVKGHVSAVLSKLKVVSRTQAVILAKRLYIFP